MAGWAEEAARNSLLKYKPQQEGLQALQQAAEERYLASVQAGKSEGTLASQAATAAIKPTEGIYANAAAESARTRALNAGLLATLGEKNPFAIAAANETAAGNERLAGSQARALSDLQARKAAAGELPAYARQAALTALAKELNTIGARRAALQGTEAADTQSELDKLRAEDRKEKAAARKEEGAHAFALKLHGEPTYKDLHPNAPAEKPASRKEVGTAKATIGTLRHYAGAMHAQGFSRAQIVQALTEGRPEESLALNAKGEPIKGQKGEKTTSYRKTPAVPGYAPNTLMSVAIDLAEKKGYVSQHYLHELEKEYPGARFPYQVEPSNPGAGRRAGEALTGAAKKKIAEAERAGR
jgi:hypothetical protein